MPSLRTEAERIVDAELIVEKHLNASCDTLSLDYNKQFQLGGYDPLVLAEEGFLPIPSAARYISACNYLNTMGIGGNQPENGCAPKCWMEFRIQALRKIHGGLPLPPFEEEPPMTVNRTMMGVVEEITVEDEGFGNETAVPDARCVPLYDPYTSTAYVGAVLDDKFQGDGAKVSAGVTQLASLLPMISLHPDIPSEARASLRACIPSLRKPLRDFMMPQCTKRCQVAYPCTTWCHDVRDECFQHNDTQSVIADIIQGGASRIGAVTKSMVGAENFEIVATLLGKLLHCRSKPSAGENAPSSDVAGSFSDDAHRCLAADTPAPLTPCSPPVAVKQPLEIGANVSLGANSTEDGDGDRDEEVSIEEKEEEEVDEELTREEDSDARKELAAGRTRTSTGPGGGGEEEEEEERAMKQLLEDSVEDVTGATGGGHGMSAEEQHRQAVEQWHPAWQNDTVIDHDSGIAMRMIDGQVQNLQ